MTRSELVLSLLNSNSSLSQAEAEKAVSLFFDQISSALAQHGRVELRGFGSFSTRVRNSRAGRNPRTGEKVSIDEKAVPFFKTGKDLRGLLNKIG